MSKYLRLREHFGGLAGDSWESSIHGIEEIVGKPLPDSARKHPVWWSNSGGPGRQCDAWVEAGWRQDGVDLLRGIVRFRRPNEGQQTNTRLNGEFKSILLAGGEISVAIVEDARIAIDGMDAPADLANKAVRRAIENLAVVGGSGGAVVLLNR